MKQEEFVSSMCEDCQVAESDYEKRVKEILEKQYGIDWELIREEFQEAIELLKKERYADCPELYYIEWNKASWHEYVRPLHPRKDWQKKAYWKRIRSNPFRKNYH